MRRFKVRSISQVKEPGKPLEKKVRYIVAKDEEEAKRKFYLAFHPGEAIDTIEEVD